MHATSEVPAIPSDQALIGLRRKLDNLRAEEANLARANARGAGQLANVRKGIARVESEITMISAPSAHRAA